MKNLKFAGLGMAAIIVLMCTIGISAQRVGGYKAVDTSTADVQAVAKFAASAQTKKSGREIELILVSKAEMQVVAGRNYRLCLKVNSQGEDGEADAIVFVQTVVYVDLKGNKRLGAFAESDCGEEDEDGPEF
jgi:hypothetical protein